MREDALREAVEFAVAHETSWTRETGDGWGIHHQDPAPWNRLRGPVHARGPVSGVILIDGETVAEWGEPQRADLTFSIAKTYLALLAGVAHDTGLLPDENERVGARVHGIGFDQDRNAEVTWKHLLQQTSEWEGTCFGVPDQVDRYRVLSFQDSDRVEAGTKGDARPLRRPGTYWEYNDVRINQLSLALLHLFRRPLPDVFRDAIMRPIGASENWQWRGYDDAWVEIDGTCVQSVPGGTHWGGGVSISAQDQARIGRMLLQGGRAQSGQVLSADWIARMLTSCDIAPFYGYLTWLNTGRRVFPSAPESSWFAIGAGSSFMWVEPQSRMVLVVRWIEAAHADAFFARVLTGLDALR